MLFFNLGYFLLSADEPVADEEHQELPIFRVFVCGPLPTPQAASVSSAPMAFTAQHMYYDAATQALAWGRTWSRAIRAVLKGQHCFFLFH